MTHNIILHDMDWPIFFMEKRGIIRAPNPSIVSDVILARLRENDDVTGTIKFQRNWDDLTLVTGFAIHICLHEYSYVIRGILEDEDHSFDLKFVNPKTGVSRKLTTSLVYNVSKKEVSDSIAALMLGGL